MRKILLYIIAAVSMVIIPLAITASILLTLAVNEDFYIRIIKNLNLVETFIATKNIQIEKEILREIEKKTGISAFKPEYDKIKYDYEKKFLSYRTINRTSEYEAIEKQIDEIDDLEWVKSPDEFKTEKDFNLYKKNRIAELKKSLKDIKEYRSKNDKAIEKSEDEMDEAKERYKDAGDDLEDKESDAKKIIESRRSDFMNEMYSDIAKIEPALTEELNRLFLDKEMKSVIKKYLDFAASWKKQKETGSIYESRLNVESGTIENVKKISLPPLSLSLRVMVNENGIEKEKNLLSEVFVEKIRETPGLKSPWVLTQIFKLSDTWLAETVANKKLKDLKLSISGGVIKSESIVLSGEKAEAFEKIMIILSAAEYAPYAALGITVLFVLLFFFTAADSSSATRISGFVLTYPSLIIIIAGLAVIIASLNPDLILPKMINDPLNSAFFDRAAFTAGLHLFAPVTGIFFILFLSGRIISVIAKKIKSQT